MDYTIVENLNMESYMTKMWLYGSDMELDRGSPTGTLNPVIFTSYYKNSDDSYFTDVFNEGTLNYYPKTGYVQLVSDDAQWPARFKVPIMDAIGGGNFEQDAWLTLDWANAEKISDDTPEAPIRDALAEAIRIAETAVKEEYTADSWTALETSYSAAVSVYNDTSSTTEALNSAYTCLLYTSYRTFVIEWMSSTWVTMKLAFALFPSTLLGSLPMSLFLCSGGVLTAAQAALCVMLSMSMVTSLAKLEVFANSLKPVSYTHLCVKR